jgi:hypothetical protein
MEAAKIVATRLLEAERALDVAASKIAELNAVMPMARLDANVSAMIGQAAFGSSTEALTHVARAREQMVHTHRHLKEANDAMGLQAVSYGDSLKAPDARGAAEEQPRLRVAS